MDSKERNTQVATAPVEGASASNEGLRIEGTHEGPSDLEESIRLRLADHVGTLRFLNSSLMVCVQALQQQDAEMDSDIALILQRSVSDRFDETIDRIEAIALGIEHEEA